MTGWEWPGPKQRTCGARAIDIVTDKMIYCGLRKGHSFPNEHHWEEVQGDLLLTASWIGGQLTYIGGGGNGLSC